MKNTTTVTLTGSEVKIKVFASMVSLINMKGESTKMVSVSRINTHLNASGLFISSMVVDSILACYVKRGYVRPYTNSVNLTYFGITKLGWSKWDVFNQKEVEVVRPSDEDIWAVVQGKVACEVCGKYFSKRGIKRHVASCMLKQTLASIAS